MELPILWYFADPMCSWCWGFAPTIDTLREDSRERMKIALVLGGLRHETAPITAAQRQEILHHWHTVHARTGQPFRFDGALPAGFVYDTEPASRAVVTASTLDPSHTFAMFKAIQTAFYAEGRDVTRGAVLADVAAQLELDPARFLQVFADDHTRARTQAHFRQARQAGVRGFPALVLQQDSRLTRVSEGWQPLDTVRDAIEAALDR